MQRASARFDAPFVLSNRGEAALRGVAAVRGFGDSTLV
jgi:hypothetical protein